MNSIKNKKCKVLFIMESLAIGGTEAQATLLISQCKQKGIECELFVLNTKGHHYHKLRENGIIVHDGGYQPSFVKYKNIYYLFRAYLRLLKTIKQIKPSLIHAYLPLANFLGALAGKMMSIKFIITSRRALGTHQDKKSFWKVIDKIANKLSNAVTVNSNKVWQDVINRDNISTEKLMLIYNGIDATQFINNSQKRLEMRNKLNLHEDQIGIVVVANLHSAKGHADLLRALVKMINLKNIRLYFVGADHGIKNQLEELATSLNLSEYVIYLGACNEIPEILSAMDIYILPSHAEGFSNSLLEGMAAGLPIIATDVGGNREALGDGHAGILIPPKNSDAIANALQQLIDNPKMRENLSAFAKARAKDFTIEKMVNNHLELYARYI